MSNGEPNSSSTSTSIATKTLQVCEGCRLRKIRCDPNERGCGHCREIGIDCVRTPVIRFKDVAAQKSMTFSPEQIWTFPKTRLRYYDETPELVDLYHPGSAVPSTPGAPQKPTSHIAEDHVPPISVSPTVSNIHNAGQTAAPHLFSEASPPTPSRTNESPWTGHSLGSSELIHRPQQQLHPLSGTEATLLRNFCSHMALWADGPDPHRSFELEASRIALVDPILRHAICAFSSRHMHRDHANRDAEALEHQSLCLQLLIPAMSGEQSRSEGVLAAVAILRQNEEMDEYDNRFHLEGVTSILNDVSAFASAGGLREATAWLCLREDIYVSLTTQTAIRTNLVAFHAATWLQGQNDWSWANRMVLLLAELLSVVFVEGANADSLAEIRRRISEWDLAKPFSFSPIFSLPRDPPAGRHLPEVWMLAPPQAIGLQYYYIAQLVMAVSSRVPAGRPFDHIHEHRTVERQVRHHLLHVIGIAKSNPRAQNTWFTAHHCLAVWGGSLRRKGDQQACLGFLHDMARETGWRIERLTDWLTTQWEDDSE